MKNAIVIMHWLPRILCLMAILFVSMFALDAFNPELTFWQQLMAFLIHLIPTFILLIFLLFAWKKELYGGILFLLAGILLSPIVYKHNFAMNNSVAMSLSIIAAITFPFILVGVLFILSYILKRKIKQGEE